MFSASVVFFLSSIDSDVFCPESFGCTGISLCNLGLFICIQSQRFNVYIIFGAAKEIIKKKRQEWYHPNKAIGMANVALASFKAKKQTHTKSGCNKSQRSHTIVNA